MSEMKANLFLSVADLASVFNRSERTIRNWLGHWRQKGIRQDGDKYYLPDIVRCFEEEFAGKSSPDRQKIDNALKVQKLQLMKLRYEVELGKFLPKDEVEAAWATRVSEFKQGLLALEFRIAGQLAEKSKRRLGEVRKILRQEILSLLSAYCRDGIYTPQIRDDLPFDLCEQAYGQFWEKLRTLPPKQYKRIVVDVKGRMR